MNVYEQLDLQHRSLTCQVWLVWTSRQVADCIKFFCFYEPSEQNQEAKSDSELQIIPRNVFGFQHNTAVQAVTVLAAVTSLFNTRMQAAVFEQNCQGRL